MAVKSRPGFAVSVERTVSQVKPRSVFYDIAPGTSHNLRFLPSWSEEGDLFFESAEHYKFVDEGNKRAWACLRVHGEEGQECPVCVLLERAQDEKHGGRYDGLVTKHGGMNGDLASSNWHAQVVPLPTPEAPVKQLYIVRLSKGTANKIAAILKMEKDNRQPLISDPDKGQAVNISRNAASGKSTRYEVMPTGIRISLDEIFPRWTEEFLDVPKAKGLKIAEPARIVQSIQETVGVATFNALLPDHEELFGTLEG